MSEKENEEKIQKNIKSDDKMIDNKIVEKTVNNITKFEKEELLEKAKISLWIDSYDEIFSDFDPREYNKREISSDFISESKRFARENIKGKFDLVILLPGSIRDTKKELIIKKRLREHFLIQQKYFEKKKRGVLMQGLFFVMLGIFFMVAATFIIFKIENPDFFITFLGVVFEPAGWFSFWEGLNLLIFYSKEKDYDLEFNKKMSKANIVFESI